ncbi:hypothetical protein BJ165DRAFT_1501909 [Panaeolus papilionaceus]|nr:hypothetical protein BJ165DRAFT_1501909 [Panaeolus papilionaceus]
MIGYIVVNLQTIEADEYTQIDAIEWSWGLKSGALDLDCKQNRLTLHPPSCQSFERKTWILLPTESVVNMFFHDGKQTLVRKHANFPVLQGETFAYRVLFLKDVNVAMIARPIQISLETKNALQGVPFNAVHNDIIMSKVHPTFAMLHIGSTLETYHHVMQHGLFKRYPLLKKISTLFTRWTVARPHSPYWDPPSEVPRRNQRSSSIGDLTEASLELHDDEYQWGTEYFWNDSSISSWARDCSVF